MEGLKKEIVKKYASGTATQDEEKYVEELFLNGEDNPELARYLKNDWNLYLENGNHTEKNINQILDHIHHLIHLKEFRKGKRIREKVFMIYRSAAAAVLIPLVILSGYLLYKAVGESLAIGEKPVVTQIYAPLMSRVQFTLPDGTTGWLNSNSKLEYTIPFKNNRNVKLTGEAYLDVNHDSEHPFSIDINGSNIKVIGTKLNINAYPDENYLEIVLEEGKIEFSGKNSQRKIQMCSSEKIIYKGEEIISHVKTDPQKYTMWKEGKLVFRGDPMEEVARRIERWYNVKVNIADNSLKLYSFRGTFDDDSLPELLRLLKMTSPIDYKIIERKLLSDGSFEKTTIILSKRKI